MLWRNLLSHSDVLCKLHNFAAVVDDMILLVAMH